MLSLQGMIAKDLDAQGVLPQKFKDLILGPKYPLIKFVNSKGIVPTADALPVSTYRFVYEDGSDLDFMNASWELQVGWYCTAVWNSGSTGVFELIFSDNVRLSDFLAKIKCYRTGSSAVEIYSYNNGSNAYSYKPTWVYMKLTHAKNSTSVHYSFKKSTSSKAQAKSSQWSSGNSISVADMSMVRLGVYSCSTSINTQSNGGHHNSGQVYLSDMKFTYNDRVILGE